MSDAYVYLFTVSNGSVKRVSARPATLEAIKGIGEPIMESQLVVDQTELDDDGFLVIAVGNGSLAVNELTAQINSFELRAVSRDREALELNDSTEGQDKYMLSLESRELRKQGRTLTNQRTETMSSETHTGERLSAGVQLDID